VPPWTALIRSGALAIIGTSALLLACSSGERAEVKLAFVNNTDALMCAYSGSPEPAVSFCNEVKPRKTSVWVSECTPNNLDLSPVTAVLTAGLNGREIYKRTAMCSEWIDSGAQITIDQSSGDFLVTDSLPKAAPSP
jgi:hypothetical protein